MARTQVSPQHVVDVLNELNKLAPAAMAELFELHVQVPTRVQGHPAAIVDERGELGFIGILNGLFGMENGHGPIAMNVDDESGRLVGFLNIAEPMVPVEMPD